MILTSEERRLFFIYNSGSAAETAAVMRDAMRDITEADERSAAGGLLRKLEHMSGAGFENLCYESGCCNG